MAANPLLPSSRSPRPSFGASKWYSLRRQTPWWIKQLLPFVTVTEPGILGSAAPTLSNNRQQVILRWSRQLEDKAGYEVPAADTSATRYLGSADHLYFRYRYTRGDRVSAGITAEKDAGEEFFKGSNRKGFDFYSAHLFIKNPVRRVKSLALGDYAVTMGQGLLVYQGFAARKSAVSTLVSRSGRPLRAFSSVSEYDFFRGAAAVFDFLPRVAWRLALPRPLAAAPGAGRDFFAGLDFIVTGA